MVGVDVRATAAAERADRADRAAAGFARVAGVSSRADHAVAAAGVGLVDLGTRRPAVSGERRADAVAGRAVDARSAGDAAGRVARAADRSGRAADAVSRATSAP
jgi:hypothetical protein